MLEDRAGSKAALKWPKREQEEATGMEFHRGRKGDRGESFLPCMTEEFGRFELPSGAKGGDTGILISLPRHPDHTYKQKYTKTTTRYPFSNCLEISHKYLKPSYLVYFL